MLVKSCSLLFRPARFSRLLFGIALAASPSSGAKLPSPHLELLLGPIPGLTSVWHSAPSETAIPLGTLLKLRAELPAGAEAQWSGAEEISRSEGWSEAQCPLDRAGSIEIAIEVAPPTGPVVRRAILISVQDRPNPGIRLTRSWASVISPDLDPSDLPGSTYAAWRQSSIAVLEEVAPGRYRTSVGREIQLHGETDPSTFSPLLEWRIVRPGGSVETRLGPEATVTFQEPGRYFAWTGPDSGPPRLLMFDIYRTRITSHESGRDTIEPGTPITFTAVTEPSGFEDRISWLASTKSGNATPLVGHGGSFTVRFEDTFSPAGFEWLGVKADNATFGQDRKSGPPIEPSCQDLAASFRSGLPQTAGDAYTRLYSRQASCLDEIVGLVDAPGRYATSVPILPQSCSLSSQPLQIRIAALYLVDAILMGDSGPYYSPTLIGPDSEAQELVESIAVDAYRAWWEFNRGRPLGELRAAPHPLAGKDIAWFGPGPILIAAGSGTEVRGSKTPALRNPKPICESQPDGADADAAGDPTAWVLKTRTRRSPTPYNCLAWAINCYSDRWLQTTDLDGNELANENGELWKRILTDHKYDVANPVSCVGQCPAGKGPKLMMMWNVGRGQQARDKNWAHAMKQEDDGDWSSKNGEGSRWKDIKDLSKFLDKFYRAPAPGNGMRELRCYCKK